MNDNDSREGVKEQSIENVPQPEAIIPPTPPKQPPGIQTQSVSEQSEETEIQKIEDRVKRAEWWMIWLTAAIAFSGLCGIGVGYLQWREIRSGSGDTHTLAEAAKTQAEKMKSMSDAADKIRQAAENMVIQDQRIADNAKRALDASNKQSKDALDATIASSRSDQRAWMGTGNNTYNVAESGVVDSTAVVSNMGKSPAMNIVCQVTGMTHPKSHVLADSDFIYPDYLPVIKQGTAFPNQQFPLKTSAPGFDPGKQKVWFEHIQSGEWIQYFFGYVTYEDIFGTHHWTHFCTAYIPATKSGTPCPIYNETDDNKKQQP